MNGLDFRSSQSSYGDPRHFSAASYGAPQPPPTKVLLDGYRDVLGPQNAEKSPYDPVCSSALSFLTTTKQLTSGFRSQDELDLASPPLHST